MLPRREAPIETDLPVVEVDALQRLAVQVGHRLGAAQVVIGAQGDPGHDPAPGPVRRYGNGYSEEPGLARTAPAVAGADFAPAGNLLGAYGAGHQRAGRDPDWTERDTLSPRGRQDIRQ